MDEDNPRERSGGAAEFSESFDSSVRVRCKSPDNSLNYDILVRPAIQELL